MGVLVKPSFTIRQVGPLLVGILLALNPVTASADDLFDLQELVDDARLTFARFVMHPDMTSLRARVKEARAVFIAPAFVKAGYFVGGSLGKGVVLVRVEETGEWSDPAFYTITGVSVGLQIGAKRSEVVAVISSKVEIESLLSSRFMLSATTNLAVGPVGGGAGGSATPTLSADVISFARSDGAYAGLTLGGLVMLPDNDANTVYYGQPIKSADILTNPVGIHHWYSARLRATLRKVQNEE